MREHGPSLLGAGRVGSFVHSFRCGKEAKVRLAQAKASALPGSLGSGPKRLGPLVPSMNRKMIAAALTVAVLGQGLRDLLGLHRA